MGRSPGVNFGQGCCRGTRCRAHRVPDVEYTNGERYGEFIRRFFVPYTGQNIH